LWIEEGLVANNEKKTEENNLQVLKGFLISTPVKTPITFAVLRGILRAIKDHLKENSFFFPHCFLETGSCESVPFNLCFFLFPCVINSDNINISYNNNTVLANFAASIVSLVCQIWFSFCTCSP